MQRSSTATVCFYDMEDGTVRMNPAAAQENNVPPSQSAQQQQQKKQFRPARKCSAAIITTSVGK
jgi:hypothetical protein